MPRITVIHGLADIHAVSTEVLRIYKLFYTEQSSKFRSYRYTESDLENV